MANTKTTALSAITPILTDLLYAVDDPGGTPISGKFTLAALRTLLGPNFTIVTASGDITAANLIATGDTSAGDPANMGQTAAEGLILTGQGSVSDVTIKNDADQTVITVPTGTIDIIVRGKVDIGTPGSIQGLDIGEGGSYSADPSGATIVEAFLYDASAASGSRFSALTITANNTLLAASGDRIYIGSPNKFWAARFAIGVANTVSDETLLPFYWNGSALTSCSMMGVLKTSSVSIADRIFEQIAESEYVAWDRAIDADWATADNVLDKIPNGTASLYWICLQVPASGLTTAPRIDDIKVRGTDSDFATGSAQLVHWGKSRVGINFGVDKFTTRAAAQPSITDIQPSAGTIIPLVSLRNNQTDGVDAVFRVPHSMDTSCKIEITLDWHASATGEVDFDLDWKFLNQGTVIGVGESDDGTLSVAITPSAANEFQAEDAITSVSTKIDVSALNPNDLIVFTLVRQGADTNAGVVYPHELVVHHTDWTLGEFV